MKLYLVQHGEALSKEVDPDRPLTVKGRDDVEMIAGFLRQGETKIDKIFHSGKTRAQQTAVILATALSPPGGVAAIPGLNPNDSVETFVKWLQSHSENGECIMLVGHLPFMPRLIANLLGDKDQNLLVQFEPGGFVLLEQGEARWVLSGLVLPAMMSKK